jgi:hypothetical protein
MGSPANQLFKLQLDVNHNADISPETSMILAAQKAGLSYGRFGSLLVNLAAHRHKVFENSQRYEVSHPYANTV